MSSDSRERTGHCSGCGEVVVADGENAAIRAGRLICAGCRSRKITYEAECLDCDWTHTCTHRMSGWYDVLQNVRMNKNNHETEKRTFEDEEHTTVYRMAGIEKPEDAQ